MWCKTWPSTWDWALSSWILAPNLKREKRYRATVIPVYDGGLDIKSNLSPNIVGKPLKGSSGTRFFRDGPPPWICRTPCSYLDEFPSVPMWAPHAESSAQNIITGHLHTVGSGYNSKGFTEVATIRIHCFYICVRGRWDVHWCIQIKKQWSWFLHEEEEVHQMRTHLVGEGYRGGTPGRSVLKSSPVYNHLKVLTYNPWCRNILPVSCTVQWRY